MPVLADDDVIVHGDAMSMIAFVIRISACDTSDHPRGDCNGSNVMSPSGSTWRTPVFRRTSGLRHNRTFLNVAFDPKPKLEFVDRYPYPGSRAFAAPTKHARSAAAAVGT